MVFSRQWIGVLMAVMIVFGVPRGVFGQTVSPFEVYMEDGNSGRIDPEEGSRKRTHPERKKRRNTFANPRLLGQPRPDLADQPPQNPVKKDSTGRREDRTDKKEEHLDERLRRIRDEIVRDSLRGKTNAERRLERREDRLEQKESRLLSPQDSSLQPPSGPSIRKPDTSWSNLPPDLRPGRDSSGPARPDTPLAEIPAPPAESTSVPPPPVTLSPPPAAGRSRFNALRELRRKMPHRRPAARVQTTPASRPSFLPGIVADLILPVAAAGLLILALVVWRDRKVRQTVFTRISFLFLMSLAFLTAVMAAHHFLVNYSPCYPWTVVGGIAIALTAFLLGLNAGKPK